jgi:ribosomal protein S13
LVWTEAGSQKRASLHVVRGEAGLSALDPGGLEVLETDLDHFAEVLTSANHTLKRALTDPRLFSGIGNAYSDEILFEARLSPLALTQKLARDEIERLYVAVKTTLTRWVDELRAETGDGFPEKVTAFRENMAAHGRYKSLACAAARRSSASATRPTRPTIARTARPTESCWRIARYRACCARTGRVDGPRMKDPVQRADDDVMGPDAPVAKGAAITGLAQTGHQRRVSVSLGVEIAGDDHRSLRRIRWRRRDFFELLQAQLIVSAALQVEIVNHQRLAAIVELGDQRDAPALAPLPQRQTGDSANGAASRIPIDAGTGACARSGPAVW